MLAMKKMVSSERTTPDEEDRGNKSIKKETKDQFEQKQNLSLKTKAIKERPRQSYHNDGPGGNYDGF